MASNDISLSSSSDSEVSETEDYELEVEGSPNSSYKANDEEGTQEAYADDLLSVSKIIKTGHSLILYLQEHTVVLASVIMNKIRKKSSRSTSATDAEKLSHLSFASLTFRFISSLVAQNTTSVLGRKNTNADSISFQPPNQIICKSVGVVFLCEVFRAHRRMFSGFPVSTF